MDISQEINYQKPNLDLTQLNHPKLDSESNAGPPKAPATDNPSHVRDVASSVHLSEQGRAASLSMNFSAESDMLSKIQSLGNSGNLGKAHAAISYDNVKYLLED